MAFLNGPDENNQFEGLNGTGRVPGPLGKELTFTPISKDDLQKYRDRMLQVTEQQKESEIDPPRA